MKFNKENSIKKTFLYGLILVVVLTITVTFIGSKANYRITASIPIAEGVVKYSPYDFNIISMYLEDANGTEIKNNIKYSETNTMPNRDYVINEENSFCYIGSKDNIDNEARIYTNEQGEHVISNLIKSDKCILYFDKEYKDAKTYILANKEILERKYENKDFNVPLEKDTTGKIYQAPDDDGTSYYFAGNPTDNWVEFGGYYWRIIRRNGDKSIRMIYQGRIQDESGNKLEPQATGAETQVGTSAFNTSNNNNAYVGYWYQIGVLRGLQTPSTAYTYLNNWFANSNIKEGSSYFNLIDKDAGFCGDRTPSSNDTIIDNIGGLGTTETRYGTVIRLAPSNQKVTSSTQTITPTLSCTSNDDLYTYTGAKSGNGNHKLAYPIGLITADEASYAGMVFNNSSSSNYLDTDCNYWTISPALYHFANVYTVSSPGYFEHYLVSYTRSIRPVINLRSDVTFTGDGTISNPYKVVN